MDEGAFLGGKSAGSAERRKNILETIKNHKGYAENRMQRQQRMNAVVLEILQMCTLNELETIHAYYVEGQSIPTIARG